MMQEVPEVAGAPLPVRSKMRFNMQLLYGCCLFVLVHLSFAIMIKWCILQHVIPLPSLTFVLSPDVQESTDDVAFPHEVEQVDTTNQGEELCTEGINILCEQPALPTKRDRKPQEQGDGTSHSEESTSAIEERREAIKASRQQRLNARDSTEVLQGELSELGMVANAEHDHANEENLLTPRTKTRLVLQALKQRKQQVSHTNNSSKGATSPNHPRDETPIPNPSGCYI
jgi:hypothetical protein